MSEYHVEVAGEAAAPAEGWTLTWIDAERRIARLSDAERSLLAVVEGSGSEWVVTTAGRRIPVSVRTWREQTMVQAEVEARAHGGPVEVRATLPGLVVAVGVEAGSEVAEGDPLLTIEAMKMQNEVRAPYSGRIVEVAVSPGQPVATGAVLLRLE